MGTKQPLQPGVHPYHVTLTVPSLQGGTIRLTAAVCGDTVDIWGQIEGKGNPLYPPRNPDKSIAKYGGIEGYLKSPDRGLFHHIRISQYLSLVMRAKNYFYQ